MQKNILVAAFVALTLLSCKKEVKPLPGPVDPGPATLYLKDISYSFLPSPYYHFEYNAAGQFTKTGFSAGLTEYAVSYNGNFISEIQRSNAVNKIRLVYSYSNNKPSLIKYINSSGVNYQRCFVGYNTEGKLASMEWELKTGDVGYTLVTQMNFTYYADGNVKDIITRLPAVEGVQEEVVYTDRYENYDAEKNADAFALYQKWSDHLLLLPEIKLQVNNPRKVTRTGTAVNYKIDYTYTYNDKKYPVNRTGVMEITSGSDAGKTFNITAQYSYY